MTKIETFAEQHRLKVTRDECNGEIIQGRRGHLYFDSAELCLMVLDGKPAVRSKWKALGGKLWMWNISKNVHGVRVQDVKITGIPLENARAAIRMCQIRQKRILSGVVVFPLASQIRSLDRECDFDSYHPLKIGTPMRGGHEDLAIERVTPTYPEQAQQNGIGGQVDAQVLVNRPGDVVRVCALGERLLIPSV